MCGEVSSDQVWLARFGQRLQDLVGFLGALANCNPDWEVMLARINPNRSGESQNLILYQFQ